MPISLIWCQGYTIGGPCQKMAIFQIASNIILSSQIDSSDSCDESLKVWFDYSNCFLPYDVLVVGRKSFAMAWAIPCFVSLVEAFLRRN